tara:strand:- start:322 stop:930 length:609 start_codon:yes stop_codon:yes gene_type:complete
MKNIFRNLTLLLSIIFLVSCSEEENIENKRFTTELLKSNKLKNNFQKDLDKKYLSKNSSTSNSYDFEEITKVYDTEKDYISYYVNSKNNSDLKLAIIPKEDNNFQYFTVNINEETKTVTYNSLDDTFKYELVEGKGINKKSSYNKAYLEKGCGQAIVDCLDQKYNNEGWSSLALWGASLFLPEVAVGVAVICVYESDECSTL